MKTRYRRLQAPDEALRLLLERVGPSGSLPAEVIEVEQASGRIAASAVYAALSSPPYHAAAMDGIAVRAAGTAGAAPTAPRVLRSPVEALPIDTGDPLPPGFDAVIPVEQIDTLPDGRFEIRAAVAPRTHVRLTGEDLVAGELVLATGRRIEPPHVGALLSVGVTRVAVRRRPRVHILPTGDELCQPGEDPSDGRVVESNSRMLAAAAQGWGAETTRLSPVPDDPPLLQQAIRQALPDCDVLLVLAGSSAGRDDHTPAVLESLGDLLVHGLALMPGKPTAVGLVDGRPVLGIPGFPVSAVVAAERLLRPLLAHLQGVPAAEAERLRARLARAVPSRPGLEEIIRVVVGRFSDGWVASPLGRGAGVLSSLTRAHGVLCVPAAREGLEARSEVEVQLLLPRAELHNALLFAGSHDLALALLDDELGARHPGASLALSPLGSQGGLAALARGEAHLAGSHLLDPRTGEYNLAAVAEMLPGRQLELVTLAHRTQGLCLRPDDARTPADLSAVAAAGMRFVNRQPGAGTRVLTDHLLARAGLQPAELLGYDHEEFTHVAAAEAVRTGLADCGLVIRAAAEARGLRFVPLAEERYDLVVPREALADERMAILLEVLQSPAFRARLLGLAGYDARETGRRRPLP